MAEILGGVIIGLTEAVALTTGEPQASCSRQLLAGTGWERDQLKPWGYYPWEKFLQVQKNLLAIVSGDQYHRLIQEMLTGAPYFKLWGGIMRQFASPVMLYKMAWSWFGPRNFRQVTSKIHCDPSGSIELSMWMKPGFAGSEDFMRICADTAIQMPSILGLRSSTVTHREVEPNQLRLTLVPPQSATVIARLTSGLRQIFVPGNRQKLDLSREIIASHELATSAEVNFSALFDQAPDALLITRGDLIVGHNKAAAVLFGEDRSPDAAANKGVPRLLSEIIRADQRESFLESGRQGVFALAGTEKAKGDLIVEIRNGGRITHASADAEFFILRDETQLIDLRQKALASQRLAALGEAAASLTHELASPVMVSLGQIDQLLRKMQAAPATPVGNLETSIQKASTHLKYVANLVQTFSQFMKRTERDFKDEPINEIVVFAQEICELKAKRAEVKLELIASESQEQGLAVPCVRHEITQAIVNLINNAIDAAAATRERYVRISIRPVASNQVAIEVEDSGRILDRSILQKMLEPFFTTKTEGTGIGLAMTNEIAKAHGGRLTVDADANTRISLILPLADSASRPIEN